MFSKDNRKKLRIPAFGTLNFFMLFSSFLRVVLLWRIRRRELLQPLPWQLQSDVRRYLCVRRSGGAGIPQVMAVVVAFAWRSSLAAVTRSTPFAIIVDAAVCRNAWG